MHVESYPFLICSHLADIARCMRIDLFTSEIFLNQKWVTWVQWHCFNLLNSSSWRDTKPMNWRRWLAVWYRSRHWPTNCFGKRNDPNLPRELIPYYYVTMTRRHALTGFNEFWGSVIQKRTIICQKQLKPWYIVSH